MNHKYNYGRVFFFAFSLVMGVVSHKAEAKNYDQQVAISQLTDYCTQYSKTYLEQYLSHADNVASLSDNDKYNLLGEVFSACLKDRGNDLRSDIGYNFQREFFNY